MSAHAPQSTRTLTDGRTVAEYRFDNDLGANVLTDSTHDGSEHINVVLIRTTLPGREEHWSECAWCPRGVVKCHDEAQVNDWLDRISQHSKE